MKNVENRQISSTDVPQAGEGLNADVVGAQPQLREVRSVDGGVDARLGVVRHPVVSPDTAGPVRFMRPRERTHELPDAVNPTLANPDNGVIAHHEARSTVSRRIDPERAAALDAAMEAVREQQDPAAAADVLRGPKADQHAEVGAWLRGRKDARERKAPTSAGDDTGTQPGVLSDEEFIRAFEANRPHLVRFATNRLAGDEHAGEDAVQETFLKAWRSRGSYRPGNFAGWLTRITANYVTDIHRRRVNLRGANVPTKDGEVPEPNQVYATLPRRVEEEVIDATENTRLLDMLRSSRVPPEQVRAVILADVNGMSYDEIAELTGAKLGTVRSRIFRGRAALRKVLTSPDWRVEE